LGEMVTADFSHFFIPGQGNFSGSGKNNFPAP